MKTKTISSLMIAVIVLTIASCISDKKSKPFSEEELTSRKVDLNRTDSKSSVEFSNKKTQQAYRLYLNIKGAMVNSDSVQVRSESKKLETLFQESDATRQLKATSKLISLTKNLKKQRDFFVTLTIEIEKLIAKAEIKSGEVYKHYCPMAFDGEGGYWLSDSKEIRNPYFGSKMLTCGSVKETLQ